MAVVQGYFVVDGGAADTGATGCVYVWRCIFTPWSISGWAWKVRFENGKDVAVGRSAGVRVQPDGENGSGRFAGSRTEFRSGVERRRVGGRQLGSGICGLRGASSGLIAGAATRGRVC
jgi:hypothetical protein